MCEMSFYDLFRDLPSSSRSVFGFPVRRLPMACNRGDDVLWPADYLEALRATVSLALDVVVRRGHRSLSQFVVNRLDLVLRRRTIFLSLVL